MRWVLPFLIFALSASAQVDQGARWNFSRLNPKDSIRLDKAVCLFKRLQPRYVKIQWMRHNGVPAPVAFCLHYRESDNDFTCHFHEGSPLTHRTRDEPKGRLLHPDPPYTWAQSAEDAYYGHDAAWAGDRLDLVDWRRVQPALDRIEKFNGFGYRSRGIAAPYLWSGTNLYGRGKYVRDGVFSATAIDAQLGCAAILKRMQLRGIKLAF